MTSVTILEKIKGKAAPLIVNICLLPTTVDIPWISERMRDPHRKMPHWLILLAKMVMRMNVCDSESKGKLTLSPNSARKISRND